MLTADNAQATSAANAQDLQTAVATAVAMASSSSSASNGMLRTIPPYCKTPICIKMRCTVYNVYYTLSIHCLLDSTAVCHMLCQL